MTDINSVVLVGRLVKDAEVKTFDSGFAVINFTIATNRSYKKKMKNGLTKHLSLIANTFQNLQLNFLSM